MPDPIPQRPPGPLYRVVPEDLAQAYEELLTAAREVAGLGYDNGSWMRRLRLAVRATDDLRASTVGAP